MSTIRRTKAALFAPISMQLLQNSSLGFDVRGMLGYLLSKPTGWEIQASDIEREGGIGRDARRRLMREAEIAGYLTFYTERDAQGKLRSGYELHEIPVPEDQRTRQLIMETGGGLSVAGSPAVGSAVAGKPTPLESIEVQSIDIENKELNPSPAPTSPGGKNAPSHSAPKNEHYESFAKFYQRAYSYPYVSHKADFVQLANWKKVDVSQPSGASPMVEFEKALTNYFATPQANHTLRDFITRYAIFHRSALDRFGKPIIQAAIPNGERQVNINRGGIGILVQ